MRDHSRAAVANRGVVKVAAEVALTVGHVGSRAEEDVRVPDGVDELARRLHLAVWVDLDLPHVLAIGVERGHGLDVGNVRHRGQYPHHDMLHVPIRKRKCGFAPDELGFFGWIFRRLDPIGVLAAEFEIDFHILTPPDRLFLRLPDNSG